MRGSAAVVIVGIAFLVALPTLPFIEARAGPLSLSPAATPGTVDAINATLTISPSNYTLSPYLWGTTVSARSPLLPNADSILAAASTSTIVWPGGAVGDDYDPLPNATGVANLVYTPGSDVPVKATTTEAEFVSKCNLIDCHAIFELPGEIDDWRTALKIINYTEVTLGFHPIAWEIGNEPELWNVTGCPWTQWGTCTGSTNPPEYAGEVHSYITNITKYEPEPNSFIGIAATAHDDGKYTDSEWIQNTTKIDGPLITGVAFHAYAAAVERNYQYGALVPPNLTQFYGALNTGEGLPDRVANVTAAIDSSDPTHSLGVYVTEIGSALSHFQYSNFSSEFSGGLSLGAQMIQAMDLNLTNVDLFASVLNTSNSWFSLTGVERPDYEMYSDVLSHLGPVAYRVNVTDPSSGKPWGNDSVFAIATVDPADHDRTDLLVINLDTHDVQTSTHLPGKPKKMDLVITTGDPVTFTPELPGYQSGSPLEVWQWNGTFHNGTVKDPPASELTTVWPSTPAPEATDLISGLPSAFTVPTQSIALFEWYPHGAEPVTVNADGSVYLTKSPGAHWFMNISGGPVVASTNKTAVTVYLPSGSYDVTAPPVLWPTPNHNLVPVERLEPFPSSPLTVGTNPLSYVLDFARQWKVSLETDPLDDGSIAPDVGWANVSEPLALSAIAAPGYAFVRWTGFMQGSGTGAVNSTADNISIVPEGVVVEIAHFLPATTVDFQESGLPAGTVWSVKANVTTRSSATDLISFVEPSGRTVGFEVGPISGYRSVPTNSSVTPSGSSQIVPIAFIKRTPPGPESPVIFEETGLPNGTLWSVTAAGVKNSSTTSVIAFNETDNRTVGYSIGFIEGYRSIPTNSSVISEAPQVIVEVQFILRTPPAPKSPVNFIESGLPDGTYWTVTTLGVMNSSTTDEIGFEETDGRNVAFQVGPVAGYYSIPRNSSVVAEAPSRNVTITFEIRHPEGPHSPLVFVEEGLPVGTLWTVTAARVANSSTTNTVMFSEPDNHTIGFSIGTVFGYRSVPRNFSILESAPYTVQSVVFTLKTPTGPTFPVIFEETGLPSAVSWSISVRGIDRTSTTQLDVFNESAGHYGYSASTIAGYAASPVSAGFTVVYGSVTVIAVAFHQELYSVIFEETGLHATTNWSVDIAGTSAVTNHGAWATAKLANGSFAYQIPDVGTFVPTPDRGTVIISGSSLVVSVSFVPAEYLVRFVAQGLPSSGEWLVRLSDSWNTSTTALAAFWEPNGTYSFDIEAPTGYYPMPSHGNVTITGPASGASGVSLVESIQVSFLSTSAPPSPPLTSLGSRALGVATAVAIPTVVAYALLIRANRRRAGGV